MKALSAEWFTHHRERMSCWRHHELDDLGTVVLDLEQMLWEVHDLIQSELAQPKCVHVTASQEGNPMSSFAPGATITFTAATDNAEGVDLTTDADGNPFTYTWTTSVGTIVPGTDTTTITVSDAPLGDVSATATNNVGIASQPCVVTVADQTPASVTVTAS